MRMRSSLGAAILVLVITAGPPLRSSAEPAQAVGTIAGTVLSTEGTPLAGIRVSAIAVTPPNPADRDWVAGERVASTAITDNAGKYRIEALTPGRYHVVPGPVYLPRTFSDVVVADSPHLVTLASGAATGGIDFAIVTNSNSLVYVPGRVLTITGKLDVKPLGRPGGGAYLAVTNSDGSVTNWSLRLSNSARPLLWWPGYLDGDLDAMVQGGETVTFSGTQRTDRRPGSAIPVAVNALICTESTRGGR